VHSSTLSTACSGSAAYNASAALPLLVPSHIPPLQERPGSTPLSATKGVLTKSSSLAEFSTCAHQKPRSPLFGLTKPELLVTEVACVDLGGTRLRILKEILSRPK